MLPDLMQVVIQLEQISELAADATWLAANRTPIVRLCDLCMSSWGATCPDGEEVWAACALVDVGHGPQAM